MNALFEPDVPHSGFRYDIGEIPASAAREFVARYHYSGKSVNNSKLNLGVFSDKGLVGVLQYGPPMNGEKTAMRFSSDARMYELNRMAMVPDEPRNSESAAIAACNKWLKANTDIRWLLSFSDGKQGNVGYIYQATNWKYLGFLLSDSFYDLDGSIVHSVTVWHRYKERHPLGKEKSTNDILRLHHSNISRVVSKQHVYVMPLRKKVEFNFPEQPYPKKDKEVPIMRRIWIQRDGQPTNEIENFVSDGLKPIF